MSLSDSIRSCHHYCISSLLLPRTQTFFLFWFNLSFKLNNLSRVLRVLHIPKLKCQDLHTFTPNALWLGGRGRLYEEYSGRTSLGGGEAVATSYIVMISQMWVTSPLSSSSPPVTIATLFVPDIPDKQPSPCRPWQLLVVAIMCVHLSFLFSYKHFSPAIRTVTASQCITMPQRQSSHILSHYQRICHTPSLATGGWVEGGCHLSKCL